jgi:hypothetical protein
MHACIHTHTRTRAHTHTHTKIYCSVYSCCYAMIVRRNMHCLVTAGKHINNTQAIARQLLSKWVTVAMDTHATVMILLECNTGNGAFSVVHAEMI